MATSKSRTSLVAIVLVAIVMIGGVGSYLVFHQQPRTETTTTTSATTVVSTQITTQPKLYRLHGKLFFDYNGNGKQEPGEPDMPDVTIALDGKNSTATNSTGWYVINDIPKGNHTIRPFPPKNFRYMCESASEFRSTREYYSTSVGNDTRKDIGLMEGFLTLPILRSTTYRISKYYDWDPNVKNHLWWNGQRGAIGFNHAGIDYDMYEGEPIVAAAPGKVILVQLGLIRIEHKLPSETFRIDYGHIRKSFVSVGDLVTRGQKIAECGSMTTSGPTGYNHLHLQIFASGLPSRFPGLVDPYAPTFDLNPDNSGFWYYDTSRSSESSTDLLTWFPYSTDRNPNGLGYWSKRNDPQYFV